MMSLDIKEIQPTPQSSCYIRLNLVSCKMQMQTKQGSQFCLKTTEYFPQPCSLRQSSLCYDALLQIQQQQHFGLSDLIRFSDLNWRNFQSSLNLIEIFLTNLHLFLTISWPIPGCLGTFPNHFTPFPDHLRPYSDYIGLLPNHYLTFCDHQRPIF